MFRSVKVAAALSSLCALAACAQMQQAPQGGGSAIVPFAVDTGTHAAMTPESGCQGVDGVTVTPCPITLTKETKPGIVVTVAGPGVVDSVTEKLPPCSNGKLCYNITRAVSSNLNKFRVRSRRTCGVADVKFFGLNSAHKKVGYAFLKLTNDYCP